MWLERLSVESAIYIIILSPRKALTEKSFLAGLKPKTLYIALASTALWSWAKE